MKILVIGNGFDLAHDLPTSYIDFLEFIKIINTDKEGAERLLSALKKENLKVELSKYLCRHDKAFLELKNQLIQKSADNSWIKWFSKLRFSSKNNTWIDFELEISSVIEAFERTHRKMGDNAIDNKDINNYSSIIDHFSEKKLYIKGKSESEVFWGIRDKMYEDLNDLIRCLEIYLGDFVGGIINKKISPDIYEMKPDKILSFNYTDTYERLYSNVFKETPIDYIHGRICSDNSTENNMVLGIPETLSEDEKNHDTTFIGFKKYFQRIYKKTGCTYKKWIEEFEKSEKNTEVFFFGHSLNSSDDDVLKELIINSKTKITVYYYNNDDFSNKIASLVHVIGQEALTSMVHGTSPKVIFKLQQDMIDKESSEWEVANDIIKLRNMRYLNDIDFKALRDKVFKRINDKDKEYFHNQKRVIDVYDALIRISKGFTKYDNKLLDIAFALADKEYTEFNISDWSYMDYTGEIDYESSVLKLISTINNYNKDLYKANYNIDNKNELLLQIKNGSFSKEEVFEQTKKLIDDFSNTDDAKLLWNCIFELKRKVDFEVWKDFIYKNYNSSKDIKKYRYGYLKDCIDEESYYRSRYSDVMDFDSDDE